MPVTYSIIIVGPKGSFTHRRGIPSRAFAILLADALARSLLSPKKVEVWEHKANYRDSLVCTIEGL